MSKAHYQIACTFMSAYEDTQILLSEYGIDLPDINDNRKSWRHIHERLLSLRNELCNAESDDREKIRKNIYVVEKELVSIYYQKVGEMHPTLLYEEGEDSTYWIYNEIDGVYSMINASSVRSIVMAMFFADGLTPTIANVRECLARYRAEYRDRGHKYADFDSEVDMFHVKNGWVNICTGVFTEHTPDILSTRKAEVSYDKDATCPTYDRIFHDWEFTPDLVRAIDQFSGNILRTDVTPARILVLEGVPGTGKSLLANIWSHIMGDLAVREYSLDSFTNNPRFCKSAFVGKRLLWFNESDPKRSQMGVELHKMIDGRTFSVERKGVSEITEHKNMCSCILTTNELPDSMSDGMESRIIYVKYTKVYRNMDGEDKSLISKLEKEASGILNRMLRGIVDYNTEGKYQVIGNQQEILEQHRITSSMPIEFLEVHFNPCDDIAGETFISNNTFRNTFDVYAKNKPGYYSSPERIKKEILKNMPKRFAGKLSNKQMSGGTRGLIGLKLKPEYKWGDGLQDGMILQNNQSQYDTISDNDLPKGW